MKRTKARKVKGLQTEKTVGTFKNVTVIKGGKPIVAVARLKPSDEDKDLAYLRTDNTRDKATVTVIPPTMHKNKKVQQILTKEFPAKEIVQRLRITLKPDKEPVRSRSSRSTPSRFNPAKARRPQSRGLDLGGGVEQTHKGRHLRLS